MRFVPESGAGPWIIPLASVTALEVSRGRKSRWLIAAGIGVFGGAVFGAATGTSMEADFSDRDKRIIAATGLGLAGGLVGGLVGSAIKTDRWEEVPLDQFRVSIAPQHKRRLRVGLSLVF
jgi:hypothetical protein